MNVPLGKWMPRIFGTWSTTITSPSPALNPASTGSEIKFATNQEGIAQHYIAGPIPLTVALDPSVPQAAEATLYNKRSP